MAMLDMPMMDSISNPYKNQQSYDEVRKRAEREAAKKKNNQTLNYGSGGGYSAPNYYDEFMKMQQDILAKQREQAINNIRAQTNSAIGNYKQQLSGVADAYQPIKNQSEVERYRAKGILRENQANRGALDSGVGRQEQLDISNNYGNRLNQINLQEEAERAAIQKSIDDIVAQRDLAIANAGADFDITGLQNTLNMKQQQYQNQAKNYRSAASDVATKKTEDPYSYSTEDAANYYADKNKKNNDTELAAAERLAAIMDQIFGHKT